MIAKIVAVVIVFMLGLSILKKWWIAIPVMLILLVVIRLLADWYWANKDNEL